MKKLNRLCTVVLALFLTPAVLEAQSETLRYEFAKDFLRALGHAKRGQNDDLAAAKNTMIKYQNSSNELIKKVSERAAGVYDMQMQINNRALQLHEFITKAGTSTQGVRARSLTQRIEQLELLRRRTFIVLTRCALYVTEILADRQTPSNGKTHHPAITSNMRSDLIKIAQEIFGDGVNLDVKEANEKGVTNYDICGAVIFQYLNRD